MASSWLSTEAIFVSFVLVLLTEVVSIAPGQECPQKCECAFQGPKVAVICTDLVKYPPVMPVTTTHLLIKCTGLRDRSGRPIVHSGVITVIPDKALQRLVSLEEFELANCPITKLPHAAFENLAKLGQVTIENTLITRMEGNIFFNSYNLQQLSLKKGTLLRYLDPILLAGQTKLRRFTLTETRLSGSTVKIAIEHLSQTLKHLTWQRNLESVTLPIDTFRIFKFGELDLTSNRLTELDFLLHTRARRLILARNRHLYRPVNFSTFKRLRHTIQLDLSECNWNSLTGAQMKVFVNLRHLFLQGNNFNRIEPDLLAALPKLRTLDISRNDITSLPESLSKFPLFSPRNITTTPPSASSREKSNSPKNESSVTTMVAIGNNRFHCNCELAWMFYSFRFDLITQILCQTGNPSQYTEGVLLRYIQPPTLQCTRPRSPTVDANAAVYMTGVRPVLSRKIKTAFYFTLARGQEVTFRCSSFADPAPRMTWTLANSARINRQPPQDRRILVNDVDITLRQGDMTSSFENLSCTAENRAGRETVHLLVYNSQKKDPPKEGRSSIRPPNSTAVSILRAIRIEALHLSSEYKYISWSYHWWRVTDFSPPLFVLIGALTSLLVPTLLLNSN